MISDYGRRWRALRAWFDDFPPDDQERLLGQMERLVALAQDRDMGAFLEWVDALLVLIERHEQLNPRAPSGERVGRGHAKASSRDPAPTIETRPLPLLRAGAPGLAAGGAAPLDAVTGVDPGQERTGDTSQASRTQAKEIPPWLSNTWCCKRGRRLVRSPA